MGRMDIDTTIDIPRGAEALVRHVKDSKDRVLLTQDGQPMAVLVPVEDMEYLEAMEDERDSRIVREAMAAYERGELETIPFKQILEELGIDLSEEDDRAA